MQLQKKGLSLHHVAERPVNRCTKRFGNSRLEVLNMTIDLVTTDFVLAIIHDLCDQSYDLFRSQVGRNLVVSPVSRFECVSGLSVYWPIIALGTRECGVAQLCRDPTVQSEFFLRVSLLKTFN